MKNDFSLSKDQLALNYLRTETRYLHEILDQSLPLSNPNATFDDYLKHLQLMRVWLLKMATMMNDLKIGPYDFAKETNESALLLISQDLIDVLGYFPIKTPVLSYSQESFDNAAFHWGVQYVIEGSYLGGSFLNRRLKPLLGNKKAHFFTQTAIWSKTRWPYFTNLLNKSIVLDEDKQYLNEGATCAFDYFILLAEQNITEDAFVEK